MTKGSLPGSTWGLYTLSVDPSPGSHMSSLFLCALSLERRNVRGGGSGRTAQSPASSFPSAPSPPQAISTDEVRFQFQTVTKASDSA